MVLSIFDATNAGFFALDVNHESDDNLSVTIQRFAGSSKVVAQQNQDLARRNFVLPLRSTRDESNSVDSFWTTNGFGAAAVLVRDPRLGTRTGVSLGTASSNQTVFTFPVTGENSRDYPIAGVSSMTVYDDAGSASISTIATQTRTVTLDAAPASNSVMTADYRFYRKVRLSGAYRWRSQGVNWLSTQLNLMEEP